MPPKPDKIRLVAPSDRIRERLKQALSEKKLSQRKLAKLLSKFTGETWSQPRVGKVLNGNVELKVDDLAALCALAGLSLVEIVREQGREFVADCTPTELRILTGLREAPPQAVDGLLKLFETLVPPQRRPDRRATIKARMRTPDE